MKNRTRLSYGERIARVAGHIAANPVRDHDLDSLAALACFSPWHFHRIYRAMMGETVAQTVRRVRLHHAAGALVGGRRPIAEIALEAGYGSVEAFTRAFAAQYGETPAAYRARGLPHPPSSNPPAEPGRRTDMSSVTIKTLEPQTVAAIRHVGPYMEIGQAFDRLIALAAGHGLMGPDTRSFGIYYDDPSATPPEECRSDACLTVGKTDPLPEGLKRMEIAGGRYASLLHKGPYAELHKAYAWLYGVWLPESGEEPANQPVVEEYLNNPRALPPAEWLTEILLPLRAPED
ncbi:AraC family transcriptional regulator [Chelativorans intermedius]|uniref:GyrI-like domain-containing protein n=1 Tax=Chelativorans intermedius TaxID=515947 RepID=A0ABV6DB67_9HYPH|nr:AraC family transcriptional regulator [Chelativorans intermedius]MCT9000220.1 AraC family transcriptional regulator [Chelativorans intermedius]